MRTREFDRSGSKVSEIGLGTWQLGGAVWGGIGDETALNTLRAAADTSVNFSAITAAIPTATPLS